MIVRGKDKGRLGARCTKCPLRKCPAVVVPVKRGAKLTVLGEAPGNNEEERGDFFVGATGRFMRQNVERWSMSWDNVHRDNVLLCRPDHKMSEGEWKKAVECCRPRLERTLRRSHSPTILALGKQAMKAVTSRHEIASWCGTPMKGAGIYKKRTVICTFHPAWALRKGKRGYLPAIAIHIQRAVALARGVLRPWQWGRIVTEPGREMVEALQRLRAAKRRIAVDIENCNVGERSILLAIGLGYRGCSVSVPWDNYTAGKHGEQEEIALCENGVEIAGLVRQILADPAIPKTLQNGRHDILELEKHDIALANYGYDTLIAHAVAAPQLPHKLGFIAGVETNAPAWKAEDKLTTDGTGATSFMKRDPLKLRRYNARDVVITDVLTPITTKRIAQTHRGMEQFINKMTLARLAIEMSRVGLAVDEEKVKEHQKNLKHRIQDAESDLRSLTRPLGFENFNPGSHIQLKRLFVEKLGVRPTKKSEKTGEPSFDEEVLTSLLMSENSAAKAAARIILRIRQWDALYRYTHMDIDRSGKYPVHHPPWNVVGAITGRWSCWVHMLPKPVETRTKDGRKKVLYPGLYDIFKARPGFTMLKADYKALELRIVAMLSGAPLLLKWFMNEEDVHNRHAQLLLAGGDENFVPSKSERTRIKNFVYNANYLGTAETIHALLVASGIDLTLSEVVSMQNWYFTTHPRIQRWQHRFVAKARRDDYIEDIFSGRRRYFYGSVTATEAVNFPVQSCGSYLMDSAMLEAAPRFEKIGGHILMNWHDAMVVEVPTEHRDEGALILKETMTKNLEYEGHKMRYSVDIEAGPGLGEMEEISV